MRSYMDIKTDATVTVEGAIARATDFLFGQQHEDGYWECELVVDSTVVCDFVLYYHWAGEVDDEKQRRCREHVLRRQLPDGGWPQFPGGPAEVNATCKAYHALRLTGMPKDDPVMVAARQRALELGGIPAMHTWGKLYLASVGCFPWKYLPIIPVETVRFPKWFPFNIYALSSWTRNMFVPLAVINHFKDVRVLDVCPSLDELYPNGTMKGDWSLPRSPKLFTLRNFFLVLNKMGAILDNLPRRWFRQPSLEAAVEWIYERTGPGSDGMGAIFPAMMNVLMALELMGVSKDDPRFRKAHKDFHGLVVGDPDDIRVAPCFSPVWDTAIIAMCMRDAGVSAEDPRLRKCADWLLDREIRIRGDWRENNNHPEASGWAFEFNNEYYPDVDDSFQVVLALRLLEASDDERRQTTIDRAMRWCRSFQCSDGGFAAFDKDVTKEWLNEVPFADHNAILDPACSDITGRALETHGKLGFEMSDSIVKRAVEYVYQTQEADGSWFGRWGCNYIYGTSHVLRGLAAVGEDLGRTELLMARDWLERHQNEDGGWGESLWSYHDDSTRGIGPSTASQTAWALLGLLVWNDPNRESIRRGIDYLIRTQEDDGSWYEEPYTGTGFPKVFYLKYTSYRWAWPLLALGLYNKLVGGE